MKNIEEKLLKRLEEIFSIDRSGHDINHLVRTCSIAKKIQEKEGGESDVIIIASLLHDVHRMIQNETGKFCEPKDSLARVSGILDEVKVDKELQNKVLHCIQYHEEYGFSKTGKTVDDIETMILQDADNLDGIGAVGVARAFTYGGANGIPIWVPGLDSGRKHFDESEHDPSEIHHFYSKMLKIKDNMNTKTGKKMAESRHEFMEQFLRQFFNEWDGKL